MKIENFVWINKGPVIAKFDVFFEEKGWGLREFKVMETNGTTWISHPSRSFKDEGGKTKYYQFTYFGENKKVAFDKYIMKLLEPLLVQRQPEFVLPKSDEIPF